LSVRSRGAPTIADGLVLDGYASGKLVALGLIDGKQQWEATVALPHGRSEIDRLVDMNPEPVVRGDTIYVTGYHAEVDAVALKDGEVLWRTEGMSSNTGIGASRRALFVTDSSSDIWRLDPRNGSDLWKQTDLHQRRLTMPVPIKESLVVGDFEGYLHALSQDDGGLTGRLQIDKTPIETTPVVFDDIIYVYTAGGTLAAVSLD
jgi:outer membrane protein assembly factor BamB